MVERFNFDLGLVHLLDFVHHPVLDPALRHSEAADQFKSCPQEHALLCALAGGGLGYIEEDTILGAHNLFNLALTLTRISCDSVRLCCVRPRRGNRAAQLKHIILFKF